MIKFVGLRVKTYSYLIDKRSKDKKGKGTKVCIIFKIIIYNYIYIYINNYIINKI